MLKIVPNSEQVQFNVRSRMPISRNSRHIFDEIYEYVSLTIYFVLILFEILPYPTGKIVKFWDVCEKFANFIWETARRPDRNITPFSRIGRPERKLSARLNRVR